MNTVATKRTGAKGLRDVSAIGASGILAGWLNDRFKLDMDEATLWIFSTALWFVGMSVYRLLRDHGLLMIAPSADAAPLSPEQEERIWQRINARLGAPVDQTEAGHGP